MMIGVIDRSKQPEKSRLFLCKPNRQTIAELHEAYDKNIKTSYNGIHELTFKIPYVVERHKKFVRNPHIDLIRGHYLIRYEKGNTKEYFVIAKPKNSTSDGKEVKEVQCYLLPYQLKDIRVRLYNDTKPLYDPVGTNGILNDTLLRKTNWSVGHIDSDILVKHRTIDVSEMSMIEFIDKLCEAFDCIVVYDTVNKRVNFYTEENYGSDDGLIIEYGKYLKNIEDDPDFDNVVTRLYVYGKDDISINKYNPTGTDYIDSFDYYLYPFERDENRNVIKHSNYMSDELCHAILDYQELINTKQGEFTDLLNQKESLEQTLTTKENEMFTLQTDLQIIQDQIDVAMANNDDTTQLNIDKQNKINEINAKQAEIDSIKSQIANIDGQIEALKNDIKLENHFSPALLQELNEYIHEKVWTNEYIYDEQELYEEAKKQIVKMNQPIVHYKIDIVDFTKVVQCQRDWDKLKYGDIVTIRYPNFNIDIKARIISIDHNEDNNQINIEIANANDIKNGFLTLKDLYQKAVSTSTQVDMSKYKWDQSVENVNSINEIINNTWDATKRRIVAGVNESVDITRRGIIVTNPNFPNEMVIIQSGVIGVSNDGGETFKNAITGSGIVGERIFGKIIAGVNLTIENDSGKYRFDSQGFEIDGGSITIRGGLPKNQLDPSFADGLVSFDQDYSNGIRIDTAQGIVVTRSDDRVKSIFNATDGIKIQVKEGTSWVDKFYFDATTGNLNIDGVVNARDLKVNGQSVLTADKLKINGGAIDKIKVEQLDASTAKITTAMIETLEVGRNVVMGANATISWSQVSNKPFIPQTASDVGALPANSPKLTYIDAYGVYTGTVQANNIVGSVFTVGNGTGQSTKLELWTGDNNAHYIKSTQAAGFRIESTGSLSLQAGNGYGIYINNAPLVANAGFRVDGGTAQFNVDVTVNSSLNASTLYEYGYRVATQSWVQSWVWSQGFLTGNGAVDSGNSSGAWYRWAYNTSSYYRLNSSGAAVVVNGSVKATWTSMPKIRLEPAGDGIMDGREFGANNPASMQPVLMDFFINIPVNGERRINLDEKFLEFVSSYDVFISSGSNVSVKEKGLDYIILQGTGTVSFFVAGIQRGKENIVGYNLVEVTDEEGNISREFAERRIDRY
jgi:phage minor structural protein